MEEIEVKFFIQDQNIFSKKLESSGAKKIHNNFLMKRVVYENPNAPEGDWIRVRQESDCVRVTFKSKTGEGLGGMREVELTVSDFEKMCSIFEQTGVKKLAYQENYREIWEYRDTEIVIDCWPWLSPYIEIEGKTKESVIAVAEELGFNMNDAVFGTVVNLYQKIYNVTLDEFHTLQRMIFSMDIPPVLSNNKRNL